MRLLFAQAFYHAPTAVTGLCAVLRDFALARRKDIAHVLQCLMALLRNFLKMLLQALGRRYASVLFA